MPLTNHSIIPRTLNDRDVVSESVHGLKIETSSLQKKLYLVSKDMSPDGSRSTIILGVDAYRNTSRPAGLLTFHQNQLREFLKASFVVARAVALNPRVLIKWIAKDYHPEIGDPKAGLIDASLPAESRWIGASNRPTAGDHQL